MSKSDRIRPLAATVNKSRVQSGIKTWLWVLGLAVAIFALVLANAAKSAQRPGSFADILSNAMEADPRFG